MTDAAAATASTSSERPSSALREMREEDDRSLKEWIDALAGEGSVKVQIIRKKPLLGPNGENVAGSLETVEDTRPDEDYIREVWGGGTFQLKIFRPGASGSYNYVRARTIVIAGPPKMQGVTLAPGGAGAPAVIAGNDDLAERAMSTMERQAQRAEQRMERLEQEARRGGGVDMAAMSELLAPLRQQLEASQQEARELRQQLFATTTRPPPADPFRDRVMEKMIDGESARIEAMRAQYESRIDRLRDSFEDQIKRLEDRHLEEVRRLEKQHDRQLDANGKSLEGQQSAVKLGYETRIDALKGEIAKLERELTQAQARIGQLEARKDQTLTEKAEELVKVREALDGIGGDKESGGKEAWYEKLIDAAGNSEAVLALVNKIGGSTGASAPNPGQPQLPPPGVPFQTPDGRVWMVGPDGQPHPVNPRALAAAQAKRRRGPRPAAPRPAEAALDPGAQDVAGEALEAGEAAPAPAAPPGRPPDAKEVKLAVSFMENAVNNGTEPTQFASSMRHLVPSDVLRFIQRVGIDEFLNTVVEPGSPLTTQRGRNFARAVAKVLLEGA